MIEQSFQQEGSKPVYYSRPQLEAIMVDANENYHVIGRGGGKTSRILSYKYARNMIAMPGSSGFIAHETYMGILDRILPAFRAGLKDLGWIEGVHYAVGRRLKGAPEPIEAPSSYSHYIHAFNGSGLHMISQDRKGSSNGLNTDHGGADECKYLNYQQFQEETLPTMRANRPLFGKLHCHWQLNMTTSRPTSAEGKWIEDKEKLMDRHVIRKIKVIGLEILKKKGELSSYKPASSNYIILLSKISQLERILNDLRLGDREEGGTVFYSESSSLENISVLGPGYFKKMRRNMTDFQFRTEILNERMDKIEGGFYANLNVEKHTYRTSYDLGLLERLDYKPDEADKLGSRAVLDIMPSLPLIVTIDWGVMSAMVIAQDLPGEYRVVKDMFVKHPELIDDIADRFMEYFAAHRCKEVFHPYYGTENPRLMNSILTYSEQFADRLRKGGWSIYLTNLGTQPVDNDRYLLYNKILASDYTGKPIKWDRRLAVNVLNSMLLAPAKDGGRKGIEKDKRSERNASIPQEEATHFSDAMDTHIDAHYMRELSVTGGNIEPSMWF